MAGPVWNLHGGWFAWRPWRVHVSAGLMFTYGTKRAKVRIFLIKECKNKKRKASAGHARVCQVALIARCSGVSAFLLTCCTFSDAWCHRRAGSWIVCIVNWMESLDVSRWVAGCLVIKPPRVSDCLSTEARSLNHLSYPRQQFLYSFIPVHFHQFHVSI